MLQSYIANHMYEKCGSLGRQKLCPYASTNEEFQVRQSNYLTFSWWNSTRNL